MSRGAEHIAERVLGMPPNNIDRTYLFGKKDQSVQKGGLEDQQGSVAMGKSDTGEGR